MIAVRSLKHDVTQRCLWFNTVFQRLSSTRRLSPEQYHQLERSYKILGLSIEDAHDTDKLKSAYIDRAKLFHPDSNSPVASKEAFDSLQKAYRLVVEHAVENKEEQEILFDIRHTAPQHRRYLEHAGYGHGTPMQRDRQYRKHRAEQAAEAVREHGYRKALAADGNQLMRQTEQEMAYARRWKTTNSIERMVDDLIRESMRKGDFDNLPGRGKPIERFRNHALDLTTEKINQIMANDGFSPEWIMLEKEIRTEIHELRQKLRNETGKIKRDDRFLRNDPKNTERDDRFLSEFTREIAGINRKIDNFNLICPVMFKQMVHVQLDREIRRVMDKTDVLSTVSQTL